VVYDFVPQQEDELSVQKGDIVIIVTENVTAEWHRCAKDGVQGLVPANFLLFEVSKRSRRKSGKDMFAMALSSLPEVQTSIITGDNNTNTDDVRRVLFDYVASASDELTISAGTRVTVLNEDVDDGWCMVRICSSPSSDGLLPERYLSPATSATTTQQQPVPMYQQQPIQIVQPVPIQPMQPVQPIVPVPVQPMYLQQQQQQQPVIAQAVPIYQKNNKN
jgi:hypothetical protein